MADQTHSLVGSGMIYRPKDEGLIRQLELKCEEYIKRVSQGSPSHTVVGRIDKDALIKSRVLGEVLKKGRASLPDFLIRHPENQGIVRSAFEVIRDYCETGGQGLSGGTGLPEG